MVTWGCDSHRVTFGSIVWPVPWFGSDLLGLNFNGLASATTSSGEEVRPRLGYMHASLVQRLLTAPMISPVTSYGPTWIKTGISRFSQTLSNVNSSSTRIRESALA